MANPNIIKEVRFLLSPQSKLTPQQKQILLHEIEKSKAAK